MALTAHLPRVLCELRGVRLPEEVHAPEVLLGKLFPVFCWGGAAVGFPQKVRVVVLLYMSSYGVAGDQGGARGRWHGLHTFRAS